MHYNICNHHCQENAPRLVFADYGPIIASIRALPQPSDSSTWEPATPVPWHCFSGRSGPEWAAAPGPFPPLFRFFTDELGRRRMAA